MRRIRMEKVLITIMYLPTLLLMNIFKIIGNANLNKLAIGGTLIAAVGCYQQSAGRGGKKLMIIGGVLLVPWLSRLLCEWVLKRLYNKFWGIWVPVFLKYPRLQKITGVRINCSGPQNAYDEAEAPESDKNEEEASRVPEPQPRTDVDFFTGTTNMEQVKKRYRDLMKIYHPDAGAGDSRFANAINEQYEREKGKYVGQ